MSHRNARLTPYGRRSLVERVQAGHPVAHVAKAMGVSRQCACRWVNRFNEAGLDGLEGRSSRQHSSLTGELIRASKTTAIRYERDRPDELVHIDVKKLGRIPPGDGWRAHGRQMGSTAAKKKARIGFDHVHSMVDDHSRLAYSEIHVDENGATCAAFIERAGAIVASRLMRRRSSCRHPPRPRDDRRPTFAFAVVDAPTSTASTDRGERQCAGAAASQ